MKRKGKNKFNEIETDTTSHEGAFKRKSSKIKQRRKSSDSLEFKCGQCGTIYESREVKPSTWIGCSEGNYAFTVYNIKNYDTCIICYLGKMQSGEQV